MNLFTFETQGTSTYLVYAIQPEDIIDSMSLGMITNNSINGLAPTLVTQMNMTKYIKYDVSVRLPVSQFFMGVVNKKRLIGVFSGIVNALLSAEEYMIDANSIILDLDYIFANVSTCETVLICLPVIDNTSKPIDLGGFFKNIVFNIQSDQTENCDYVAKIINYLNGTPQFSLTDFKKILDDISRSNSSVSNISNSSPMEAAQSTRSGYASQTQFVHSQPAVTQVPQQVVQQVTQPQVVQQQIPQRQSVQQIPQQTNTKPQKEKNKKVQQTIPQPEQPPMDPNEKPMSMFYLLQHYNKENAAKYKAQKAAKKAHAGAPAQQVVTPQKQEKVVERRNNNSFAIPGQPDNSFAIPGQDNVPVSHQQVQPVNNFSSQQPVVRQTHTPVQPVQQVQQVQQVSQGYTPNTAYSESPSDFGPTTVLGGNDDGKTAVLSDLPNYGAEPAKQPVLVRIKNNERIPINKPYFRIGKEKSYVDYFIGDNSYISRGHASIITRDGRYYIVDNNSSNHTYVNGNIITSSTEVEIQHGDAIRLANEEFEFKLF